MRNFIRSVGISVGAILLSAASCSAPQQSVGGEIAVDTVGARAVIAQLEVDARALGKTDGCATTAQCRSAPVGARPCGGPRTYLAYCAATTDSVALYKKLDDLKAAEMKLNASLGLTGTCDFLMPPQVASQGGSCRAVSP